MSPNKNAKPDHEPDETNEEVRMTDQLINADGKVEKNSEVGDGGLPSESVSSDSLIQRLRQIQIDDIWRRLGANGKFQTKQTIYAFMSYFISWHLLSIIFIGYVPDHQCDRPLNESFHNDMQVSEYTNTSIEYSNCQITTFYNDIVEYRTGCIHGYNYSVPEEQSFVSEWNLVCQTSFLSGLPQSVLILGQGAGSAMGQIADKMGRRSSFVYSQALLLCVTFGTAFVEEYWSFLLLRFITGLLTQIVTLSSWTILVEIISNEQRPLLALTSGLAWVFCLGLLTPVAYFMRNGSWRTLQMATAVPSLLFIISFFLAKESLRWLIVTGRLNEALKLLKIACRQNNVSIEYVLQTGGMQDAKELLPLKKMANSVESIPEATTGLTEHDKNDNSAITEYSKVVSTAKKESGLKLFTDSRIRYKTLTICFSWFVNVLVYYGLYLTPSFNIAGRYLTFLLNTVSEIPMYAAVWFFLSRIGRKKCSIVSHGFAGIFLLLYTILSSVSYVTESAPALLSCLLIFGKMSITASFTVMYMYTPELFPTNLRNAGLGIASLCGRFAGMIVPYSGEMAKIRSWIPGTLFSVLCLIVTVLMIILPETMGRDLPQTIDDMVLAYKNKSKTQKSDRNRNETLLIKDATTKME